MLASSVQRGLGGTAISTAIFNLKRRSPGNTGYGHDGVRGSRVRGAGGAGGGCGVVGRGEGEGEGGCLLGVDVYIGVFLL